MRYQVQTKDASGAWRIDATTDTPEAAGYILSQRPGGRVVDTIAVSVVTQRDDSKEPKP